MQSRESFLNDLAAACVESGAYVPRPPSAHIIRVDAIIGAARKNKLLEVAKWALNTERLDETQRCVSVLNAYVIEQLKASDEAYALNMHGLAGDCSCRALAARYLVAAILGKTDDSI